MSNKPEALRLADELVETPFQSTRYIAAAERRRLHEVNQELLEALEAALKLIELVMPIDGDVTRKARAAIKKSNRERSMKSETDCELLKLAAKAAGYELIQYSDHLGWQILDSDDGDTAWFDPINDDGDAFRLAVKLYIDTEFFLYATQANFSDAKGDIHHVNVGLSEGTCNGSRAAASRRAIVRAAAEIGRNME